MHTGGVRCEGQSHRVTVGCPFVVSGGYVGTPFKFDIQVECFEKSGPDASKERRIGGFVSTSHVDRQGETLLQEGLDFEPFLKGGWFNDNHDHSTEALVGYPELAELRPLPEAPGHQGWYVEGYLLKGHQRSDNLWNIAQALQKSGRRLGFSVEGSIAERDQKNPKIVKKAIVREVAITRCPVNTNTGLDVLAKSLSAGNAVADPGTAPGEGFPLRTESLEGNGKKKKKKKKRLTKGEAVERLCSARPDLDRAWAEKIVAYALKWHAAPMEDSNAG